MLKQALVVFGALVIGGIWFFDGWKSDNLITDVNKLAVVDMLENKYTYFYLHLFTFLPVFLLSFDRKVAYYKTWKTLFPAVLIVGLIFIAWDVFFTARGVWGFNEKYVTGIHWFYLPVEEWLFFVTVPFACIFIYECLRAYFPDRGQWKLDPYFSPTLGLVLLCIGCFNWMKIYTATTFIASGIFVLWNFWFIKGNVRTYFYWAYGIALIPFMLVNGVLTGMLTATPIVMYDPLEYLGVRIITIPVDDAVYGFLLLFGVVTLYEHLKRRFKGN